MFAFFSPFFFLWGVKADMGTWDPSVAVQRVIAGEAHWVDANLVKDSSQGELVPIYSLNEIAWGLVGDVAATAEGCRCLGPSRYDLCAFWGLLKSGFVCFFFDSLLLFFLS